MKKINLAKAAVPDPSPGNQPNTSYMGNADHAHLKPTQRRGEFYYQKRLDLIKDLPAEKLKNYQDEFHQLINNKAGLIHFFARHFSRRNEELFEELLQEGYIYAWT